MIPSWTPFLVYHYGQHYLRRSMSKYTGKSTEKGVHMTNLAVMKKKKLHEDAVWHWEQFKEYVNKGHFNFDVATLEKYLFF